MKNKWKFKKLGEVCDLQNGFAFKSSDYVEFSNTLNFRMSQIRPGGKIDLDNNPRYLPDKYSETYKEYLLNDGDVVIAMTDLATETKILGVPTIIVSKDKKLLLNQRVGRLCKINHEEVFVPFLKIALESPQVNNYYKTLGRGGLQINICKQEILNALIPIPSLSEQKRIVAILDKTFASIEEAKEKTEKNIQNIQNFFNSSLSSTFANPNNEWVFCSLEDHVKFIDYRGKTPKKTSYGLRLITAKNVRNGFVKRNPEEFVGPEIYDEWMVRGIPKIGDVLFTTEAPLANVAQLDTEEKVVFAQRIIILQPKVNKINQTFLKYLLLSKPIKQKILDKATGATAQGIKASLLKKIEIYFPKLLIEQKYIVTKLDILSAETKKLEDIYRQKLKCLEELKKSILQKAFNGELTVNDTENIFINEKIDFKSNSTNKKPKTGRSEMMTYEQR